MISRLVAAALWVAPSLVLATTRAGELTPASLARLADRVVLAKVGEVRVEVPGGDMRRMATLTALEILAEYKGQGPKRVELMQLGGKNGPWESHIPGDATFTAGEKAVIFLRCRQPKTPERCSLVGLADGKLSYVEGEGGKKQVLVRSAGEVSKRPLEAVVSEIRQAGSAGAKAAKGAP